MTGNKEAHLKIEVVCYACTTKEHKTNPWIQEHEVVEMKLLTDVEGSGEALYECPKCFIKVTLRAYLDN